MLTCLTACLLVLVKALVMLQWQTNRLFGISSSLCYFFNGNMEMLKKISTWSIPKLLDPAIVSFSECISKISFRSISIKKNKLFILTSITFFCGRTSFPSIRFCFNEVKNTTDRPKKNSEKCPFFKAYKRSLL